MNDEAEDAYLAWLAYQAVAEEADEAYQRSLDAARIADEAHQAYQAAADAYLDAAGRTSELEANDAES